MNALTDQILASIDEAESLAPTENSWALEDPFIEHVIRKLTDGRYDSYLDEDGHELSPQFRPGVRHALSEDYEDAGFGRSLDYPTPTKASWCIRCEQHSEGAIFKEANNSFRMAVGSLVVDLFFCDTCADRMCQDSPTIVWRD